MDPKHKEVLKPIIVKTEPKLRDDPTNNSNNRRQTTRRYTKVDNKIIPNERRLASSISENTQLEESIHVVRTRNRTRAHKTQTTNHKEPVVDIFELPDEEEEIEAPKKKSQLGGKRRKKPRIK